MRFFPVTLVLGDRDERVTGDELHQVYFIYMNRWDEAQFATSASRLATQHMVSQERKTKIISEILRRANRVAPVSTDELHEVKRNRKTFRCMRGEQVAPTLRLKRRRARPFRAPTSQGGATLW